MGRPITEEHKRRISEAHAGMFREKYPDVLLIVATKPILTMMEKCYGR